MKFLYILPLILFPLVACKKGNTSTTNVAYRITKSISYNNVNVDVIIDKPENNEVDVLMVYHGTVVFDNKIHEAATTTLNNFKAILGRKDMMIVSVVYPEENLLMGDNVKHAEAALLWVKDKANAELGIKVKKIFLAGHSQGGYLVTILNTMHATNGVIANAPGPLNLVYRCNLEETGQVQNSVACSLLSNTYGSTNANPNAYHQRSLLNYTANYKGDILFTQGLNDSPIQLFTWPTFKQNVLACTTCKTIDFIEVNGFGHTALFESSLAKTGFNNFINSR